MTNKTIGKYGEQLAKDFLIKKGFEILDMNFHYSKLAEIDIIAKKDNIIHFIEVKTRSTELFGNPLEAVNKSKLKQIYMCANYYLQNSKKHYKNMQIDVIGIMLLKNSNYKIDFIENVSYN